MIRYFRDRVEAVRLLAKKLKIDYANKPDVLAAILILAIAKRTRSCRALELAMVK